MSAPVRKSWKARLTLVYIALLLVSTGVRRFYPWWESRPVVAFLEQRVQHEEHGLDIRFFESLPHDKATAATVLILYGIHDTPDAIAQFAETLKETGDYHIVVLDMGDVSRVAARNGAVSAESMATSVAQFATMKGLGEEVHVVGFGYGATVAIHYVSERPDAVASMALVRGYVSNKHELLGDSLLNRAIHGFRYLFVWLVENLTPHFGWVDSSGYGTHSASFLFSSDLREVENVLENWMKPVFLLVEGEKEKEDLAAVMPHSVVLRGDMPYENLAMPYHAFLEGESLDYEYAHIDKKNALGFDQLEGRVLDDWFAGSLLALATFASEDLACIGGGLLAASGSVSIWVAVAGCLLGIFFGDLGIYLLGRVFGRSALSLPYLRKLATADKIDRYARWFEKKGVGLVVLTRFFPGSRVPTYFAAGVVGVHFGAFAFALLVAAAIWTPILVVLSYFLGDRFLIWFEEVGASGIWGLVLFLAGFVFATRIAGNLLTWRGRRLLLSRYRRFVNWEFWPVWALYPPVLVYIAWLMVRNRSATLPSVINPCMPVSGLVYESKSQILRHLQDHGVPVARFETIGLEGTVKDKGNRVSEFMRRNDLEFPIVLKPDIGQRGQGVAIAKSEEEVKAFFDFQEEDTIVQEFVPGVEYGVFYSRSRNSESGTVSSITDKRMLSVEGDGVSTLERLILGDKRAVCMARFFMKEFESQLDRILPKGELFALSSIGTHCRGALFLDGEALISKELSEEVDRFSSKVDGFHFGRYDIRAPSTEAFAKGEELKVIELNGLTSEPTSMYDPKHSVFFAWRTLMRQWRLVFQLAKENRQAGIEPDSVKSVVKLAIGYLRGLPSRDLS